MPLRSFILNNFWLKSVSLILATLIWLAIQSNQSDSAFSQAFFHPKPITVEFTCPVRVMTSPASRSVFSIEPGSVIVKVHGQEAVLKTLSAENIRAYVRPADRPAANHLFRVEVVLPREVTLIDVVPEQVFVQPANLTNK